jgi:hypothetical protein
MLANIGDQMWSPELGFISTLDPSKAEPCKTWQFGTDLCTSLKTV